MNAKIWMEHFKSQADGDLPPSSYQPPTDDQPGFVYLNRRVKSKHLPPSSTGSVQVVSPVQQAVQQAKNEIIREEKEDEGKDKKKRKTLKRKQSKRVSTVRRKQRKEDVFDRY